MLLFGNGSVKCLVAGHTVVMADALALFNTVLCAGGSLDGVPVVVRLMTERFGIIILARLVFMNGAFVDGITFFGTCRRYRFGRDIGAFLYFCLIAAAVTTAARFAIAAVYSRSLVFTADEIPLAEVVAERLNDVGIHNGAAAQTYTACVAVIMACGRNDRRFTPVVTERGLLERICCACFDLTV